MNDYSSFNGGTALFAAIVRIMAHQRCSYLNPLNLRIHYLIWQEGRYRGDQVKDLTMLTMERFS